MLIQILLKQSAQVTTFWLSSAYVLTTFWLHSDYFWLFMTISVYFWLTDWLMILFPFLKIFFNISHCELMEYCLKNQFFYFAMKQSAQGTWKPMKARERAKKRASARLGAEPQREPWWDKESRREGGDQIELVRAREFLRNNRLAFRMG